MKSVIKQSDIDLTLDNYKKKKFSVSPDFIAYRYNAKGEIEELGNIDDNTLKQIGDCIKENILNEVDRVFNEWKEKFITEYQINYDKEHLQKAELKTVNQILRGKKNTIIDSFGITHEIISYLKGMPVLSNGHILLKLSPVFSLSKVIISEIRRYMVFEYNKTKPFYEYIKYPKYGNLSLSCILPEVLIKYQSFLKDYSIDLKTNSVEFLPPLPKCFNDVKEWGALLQDPRIQDLYEKTKTETYKWKGKKNLLAGLAWRLLNKNKLIVSIKSGQDLAKIFCPYFEVKFNVKDERAFRPERALTDRFLWIN